MRFVFDLFMINQGWLAVTTHTHVILLRESGVVEKKQKQNKTKKSNRNEWTIINETFQTKVMHLKFKSIFKIRWCTLPAQWCVWLRGNAVRSPLSLSCTSFCFPFFNLIFSYVIFPYLLSCMFHAFLCSCVSCVYCVSCVCALCVPCVTCWDINQQSCVKFHLILENILAPIIYC